MMCRARVAAVAGAVLLLVVHAGVAAPQGLLRVPRGAGEVGLELTGESWASTNGAVGDARFLATRQWLRLPLSGALLPRPFTVAYGLTLRPQFDQQSSTLATGSYLNRNMAFDATASAFMGSPISLTAYMNRTTGTQRGGIGTISEFVSRGAGTALRYQNAYLPIVLQQSVRSARNAWQGDIRAPVFPRDDRMQSLVLSAQNSKTAVSLSRVTFTDRIGDTGFGSTDGSLQHAFRWGKGSNLTTSIESQDRSGRDAQRRLRWTQGVRLQHTRALSSDLHLSRYASSANGVNLRGHAWGFAERWLPRPWLLGSLDGMMQSNRYSPGYSHTSRLLPSVTLSHPVAPFTVALVVGGTYERSNRFIAGQGWVDAASERFTVDVTHRFRLAQPYADVETIRIMSADETIVYAVDLDYRLTLEGDYATVQVLPGSRIADGDVVVASYRIWAVQAEDYGVLGETVSLSASSRLVTAHHTESMRRVNVIDTLHVPGDRGGHEQTSGIAVRGDLLRFGRLVLDLERRSRQRSVADFTTAEARLTMLSALRDPWQSSMSLSAARSKTNGRRSEIFAANGTVHVAIGPGLRAQGGMDAWTLRLPGTRGETLFGGTLELDWQFGMMETQWRFAQQDRQSLQSASQRRFSARVLRRV